MQSNPVKIGHICGDELPTWQQGQESPYYEAIETLSR